MYITIIVKLIVGMVCVLAFLRLAGKTQMAQMTPTDTVNSFVVGALIGGIIYSPDLTIWDMLFAISIWAVINLLVRYFSRYNFFNHLIHGRSEYIVRDGVLNIRTMEKNNLDIEQLMAKLREQNIFSMEGIDHILFETDGQLTVNMQKQTPLSYLLLSHGKILKEELRDAKRTEEWLRYHLEILGYPKTELLFCVIWTPELDFYVVDKEGNMAHETKQEIAMEDREKIEQEQKSKAGAGAGADIATE